MLHPEALLLALVMEILWQFTYPRPPIPSQSIPYKKAGGVGMVPKPSKKCTYCGVCVTECPVQAIDKENPKKAEEKACISCMRCISVYPPLRNHVMLSSASLMLKKLFYERKDCQLFL